MILDGVQWVVSRSHHVRIDETCLGEICAEQALASLRLPDWQLPVVPAWRDERLVDFFLLFNSINFCYWGQPKWTVTFQGQSYDGAYGMMAALTRGLDEGQPLLDGAFLANTSTEQFRHLLRGNVPIPLESERLAIWQACGPVLEHEFDGRWHSLVGRAGGSAVRLVELLVTYFPSWDDVADYQGRQVAFYKRAQLAAGMLYQAFGGQGWGAFADIDELTVYADYKLPKVLRRLGILVYDEALAAEVDQQVPIPAGSPMEVEIRAATVWAGELIRQALQVRAPELTAAHVDFWLWETSQHKSLVDRPYHRTLTTAY
jgi:hypothetical protein